MSVTHRDTCRLCGSAELELVLPILPSAIGDAFVSAELLNEPQETYPLDAYLCLRCGHLQNLDIVDPKILFGSYTYRTSSSLGLVEHFRAYAASVVRDLALEPGSFVVEIGSNDGSLLRAFKDLGLRVRGVDAAANIADEATAKGIPTIGGFFTPAIAQQIRATEAAADLVCANNVYAHIDNMDDVTQGIRNVMSDNGAFVFEVSYVPDMIDNLVFDTIYHEHVSYHSLLPLEKFFRRFDLMLFDAMRVPSKGGSIGAFAQPLSTGKRRQSARLLSLFEEERARGVENPETYRKYFSEIEQRKTEVISILKEYAESGKKIAAYGASTTTTTLLFHFEMAPYIDFIVDDNPVKQGTFSPGCHIPVLPSSALLERKPDLVVVLAWTYADPIIHRNQAYMAGGGKFLLPLPNVTVRGIDRFPG